MHALLSAFAPIWMLTAIGYAVGRSGLLGAQAEAVLGRFVFHVAMPAALFTMVSGARLNTFANSSMVAFAAGTALVCGLGFLASGRLLRPGHGGPGDRQHGVGLRQLRQSRHPGGGPGAR